MDVEKVINKVVARFIGTKHERDVKAIQPMVAAINELEPEMKKLSDAEITARTEALKGSNAMIRTTNGGCKRRLSRR
jgi:preprotein translocase subunit SecA